jgi:thymidylate synthase (FAD)
VQVLDKGEVSLLQQMGNDLTVVAAARVSNGVGPDDASKGNEADQKLITFLLKHRHGTPFEHVTFQFYVKCPLFVRSEWHRHRIASYNEISGRYVQYEPEFYLPEQFRVQAVNNKQGSFIDETKDQIWQDEAYNSVYDSVNESYERYMFLIEHGVAKEMARMILPLNLYTQFYFTVNARSLMNFLSLRCATDAQWEIRQYALGIRDMFKEALPMTFQAWESNDFVAP